MDFIILAYGYTQLWAHSITDSLIKMFRHFPVSYSHKPWTSIKAADLNVPE